MRRSSSILKWLVVVGGAVTLLIVAGWIALHAGLVTAAETALSELFLSPVRIESARIGWPPGRISFADVRVGDDAAFSAEQLVVEARVLPLFRRELRDVHLELYAPTIHLRSSAETTAKHARLLRRMSDAAIEGLRIESVKVDGAQIVRSSGRWLLAPFDLHAFDIARQPEGPIWMEADVDSDAGTGRLAVEIASRGDGTALSVEAEATAVSLGEALRSGDWKARGMLSGRVAYDGSWSETEPTEVVTVDAAILDFEVVRESMSLSLSSLRVGDLRLDVGRGEVLAGEIEASNGVASADFFEPAEPDDAAEPWRVHIARADVSNVRIDSAPGVTLEALRLRDVGTPWETGTIDLDAIIDGGRIRLTAERPNPDAPGTARLAVDALPIAHLIGGAAAPAKVARGQLDLRVEMSGPPGIQGQGEARVHDLSADILAPQGERELLELTDLHVDLHHFSLTPFRLWVRTAQIIEPRLWLRWNAGGLEVERLWTDERSTEAASWFQESLASAAAWAGTSPTPETPPGEVGVRLTDGEILLTDQTRQPPLTIEFSELNALVGGPAGPDGPVDLELEVRSAATGSMRLRGRTGPEGTTASGTVGPLNLGEFDGYLRDTIGFTARQGTLELGINARVEPQPAMNVRLSLHEIELVSAGRGDPLESILGAPLPLVVERLQRTSGQGRLDLSLQGGLDRPNYGFLEALPAALKRAIAEATAP